MEAIQEAGANLEEKMEEKLPREAAGSGKEKREEKKLLMHIVSAELSMTN